MGTEILLAIIVITTIVAGATLNNFVKNQNRISQKKRYQRASRIINQEKVDRERKEIEFFSKYPQVYKIVKTIHSDGSSISLNIEDDYKSIFIEYLHRFKDFARIKGFSAHIKISAKEDSKQLSCKFDMKPLKKSENKISPEELFRNYLVSYPVFT